MVNKILFIIVATIMFLDQTALVVYSANDGEVNVEHEIVRLHSPNSKKVSDAAFFPAQSKKSVILIPEWLSPKESFYQFAEELHQQGFMVLTIEGDILSEVTNFLLSIGVEEINLIGTGFGGEVILHALQNPVSSKIKRAIVISPYEAVHVRNDQIEKLFISSKKDWQVPVSEVIDAFTKSIDPKQLKLYPGSAHGQSFFRSKQSKKDVRELIIKFISGEQIR